MNHAILTPEVQDFLRAHLDASPSELALRKSPFSAVSSAELADQLDGMKRARKKLPLWFDTPTIYYPSKLSIEQASSAETAMYKSQLIPDKAQVVDLTGGFGIDSYYFSQRAKTVIHCERNPELSQIAAYNAQRLKAANITFIAKDGLDYLGSTDLPIDVIYLDPSRRVKQQKVFRLRDCEPNVVEELPFLLQKCPSLLIKAAPLLDIKAALDELTQVKEVHILSVHNECKELLFVINANYHGTTTYHSIALAEGRYRKFIFSLDQEKNNHPTYSEPLRYLYEPDAALLKSGGFKSIAISYGIDKLHLHTHLYTSETIIPSFIGRCFEIGTFETYTSFKKRKEPLRANVTTRNFPLKPEQLKKKHQIKDGGTTYLFFCTGPQNDLLVIYCHRIDL
ncbi:hypothetical protein GCM10023231_20700 [Olivibacter ginsenosidimutans]|uniref:THUMP-like domain-containing protein n=1 Tax=Olivibacter ginsenosidimutans TaxID=1176537 RepID=A0ABP9BD34_9SPHI